ncbi:helix-turn-helix domain-containing protein [uncultured Bacteroides sp.]|uniref:helix-turn-helix domain-containing protein n=1 Tax=uncultured Bacteroides sp. TaxID=162156 RepID=UPI00280C33FB|nr:helix-turn-helix domain-containing protein [uncultured Bacteroides sp.]
MELIINNKLSILSEHRYLTDAELAKCLKISRRTLQEYRNNGIIPFYHVGGKILYREADIEEFLEINRQEAIE